MVVDAVRLPEVPVMVTVAVPAVAELLAVSDRTLVVVVLAGLKDAVTPLGSPEATKLTLPVKPPAGVTVMVLVPAAPPGVIDILAGAAERAKLGVAARLDSQMPRPQGETRRALFVSLLKILVARTRALCTDSGPEAAARP